MLKIMMKHAPKAHVFKDGFNTVINIKDDNDNEILGGTLLQRAYLVGEEERVILMKFSSPSEIKIDVDSSAYIMEDCVYLVTQSGDYKCNIKDLETISSISEIIDLR